MVLAKRISIKAKLLPSPTTSSNPKNALGIRSAVTSFFWIYSISAISERLVAPGSVVIGSGAAGTWGISISGNAATVTDGVVTSGSYANPDWITSLASSKLTGTIPIETGGTGQGSKTAAFNALSPLSTKGDIVAHSGTDNVRVPVGSDGQVLVADSAETVAVTVGVAVLVGE